MTWHHPECDGECIACLIEREVQTAFGNQGLAYLHRSVAVNKRKEWNDLTAEDEIALAKKYRGGEIVSLMHEVQEILREKNK